MNAELQSWAAGAIVLVTVVIFLTRVLKGRKRKAAGSCGSGCGCSASPAKSKVAKG
ncbi:FeoB-associated Cys-rich membrane protein [Verrucomicrobium sp. BvORR034]|jgi:cell division septation protein DedD|uniref:FeoB-associated Cys-rich membrane protein n=1 Tax=Verrucomicrobium sp. BvORR034 TaxID=1396418 RepID=UPI000ACAB8AC|nr:FeoB-associated Cys-rich membrane protein [Verrucomicrobium sp. BvORR034]